MPIVSFPLQERRNVIADPSFKVRRPFAPNSAEAPAYYVQQVFSTDIFFIYKDRRQCFIALPELPQEHVFHDGDQYLQFVMTTPAKIKRPSIVSENQAFPNMVRSQVFLLFAARTNSVFNFSVSVVSSQIITPSGSL